MAWLLFDFSKKNTFITPGCSCYKVNSVIKKIRLHDQHKHIAFFPGTPP